MEELPIINGRGAQINTPDPFSQLNYELEQGHFLQKERTKFIEVFPKSIVNSVNSPDLNFNFSINPYQGCEHGCVYCYARNTHPFWGYSAGRDFESKILFKKDAVKLLEQKLCASNWKSDLIMLSGNTDCYQPIEKDRLITRRLLQTLLKFRNPVGVITKNDLVLRDLDILKALSQDNLIRVAISITTENESLREKLEPRTSTIKKRFETVELLAKNAIPVFVMMAPIIPGLTDTEILSIAKRAADVGALDINYGMVRLNGDVETIFADWMNRIYPERTSKVLNQIKSTHEGKLGETRWKKRMKGSGNIAKLIKDQVKLAKKLYFPNPQIPAINYEIHAKYKPGQMKLFD